MRKRATKSELYQRKLAEGPKESTTGRQGKGSPKSRYNVKLTDANYDYLNGIANRKGVSMAVALNEILCDLRHSQSE